MQLIPLSEEAASLLAECEFTAGDAYRLGSIDGRLGLPDASKHAAPHEAAYRKGYEGAHRLALGTPVRFVYLHGEGVISGHDRELVRVSWFNEYIQQVQHRWVERTAVKPLETTAASR